MVTDPSMFFKHAFVTGATGIVGVPLCIKLKQTGARVTAFSRGSKKIGQVPGINQVFGDIVDTRLLEDVVGDADVIFHAAAAVHGSVSTFQEFERVNVAGTENVIRAARKASARLVHVSSVNVQGFQGGCLRDSYAATKSRAEELVLRATEDGLDAVVVRPATVFGSEPGNAGLLIDRLLSESLKVLPAPSRKISPVWSEDLAQALIKAAESGKLGRIYTIAGPTITSREFVLSVAESAGLSIPRITIPTGLIAMILQLAWRFRMITRWTPPVSVESLKAGSVHDGTHAANELGFSYTPIKNIFDNNEIYVS